MKTKYKRQIAVAVVTALIAISQYGLYRVMLHLIPALSGVSWWSTLAIIYLYQLVDKDFFRDKK